MPPFPLKRSSHPLSIFTTLLFSASLVSILQHAAFAPAVKRRISPTPISKAPNPLLLTPRSPQSHNSIHLRHVPPGTNRFDYPWRLPSRVHLPTLTQSRHRVLYSPLRDTSGDGLGHAMATFNADLSTAMRLNLTYTHRIASYGSLTQIPLSATNSTTNVNRHGAAVEQLFGWGVGEIPREHLQYVICPHRKTSSALGFQCRVCNHSDFKQRSRELQVFGRHDPRQRFALKVKHVIELPTHLSYRFPYPSNPRAEEVLTEYARAHNEPYTVFSMPSYYCGRSPAYSSFPFKQRAFFFHKYWDAHARRVPASAQSAQRNSTSKLESFEEYRLRVTRQRRIGGVIPRGHLEQLKQHNLHIAIHARRGDFFLAGRYMVPTAVFARLVRVVVAQIIQHGNDTFTRMPITVAIYSEGRALDGRVGTRGHDVSHMSSDFVDSDGRVQDSRVVERLLRNQHMDKFGDIFNHGLTVRLCVSQDTVKSVHEMLAADIFIGSASGLSVNVVASMSRAAFTLVPCCVQAERDSNLFLFKADSHMVSSETTDSLRVLWRQYVEANEASTIRAILGQKQEQNRQRAAAVSAAHKVST